MRAFICLSFWGDRFSLQLERKSMYRLARCFFGYVGRGWISVSLHPYFPQRLPPLCPLQHLYLLFLLLFSPALRFSIEMEDPTCGPQGMMILCRSQPVLGSLLSLLKKSWVQLQHSIPSLVHLLRCHRSPFGGKGQAKDLKQALLRRQPKHLLAFQKKTKCVFFSLFPFFTYALLALPSPWYISLSFSLRTMKISSMGG